MVGDTTMERSDQIGARRVETPACEIGEPIRIGLAGDQRIEDRSAADTDDVAHHLREFQIGVLERLLNPQHVASHLVNELPARAREIAQLLNRRGWNEAAADQSVRQQVGDPGGIVHSALAARHVADVHRVGEHQGEVRLEHMPHRLPVNARGLHPDVGAAVRREPLGQVEQPAGRRRYRAMVVRNLRARRDPGARGDAAGVHVQTGTARIQDFHDHAPSRTLAWSPRRRNLRWAVTAAIRGARGTPGPTRERAVSTNGKPTSAPASPQTVACFMTTRARRRRVGN